MLWNLSNVELGSFESFRLGSAQALGYATRLHPVQHGLWHENMDYLLQEALT